MSGEEEARGICYFSNDSKWLDRRTEELQRSLKDSKDSAIRSARSVHQNSSTHLRSFQDFVPHAFSHYKSYEYAFFNKIKEGLMSAKEHPAAAIGITITAALFLMPGPRRLIFRNMLGRFQRGTIS